MLTAAECISELLLQDNPGRMVRVEIIRTLQHQQEEIQKLRREIVELRRGEGIAE
jgi:hypothetical protein